MDINDFLDLITSPYFMIMIAIVLICIYFSDNKSKRKRRNNNFNNINFNQVPPPNQFQQQQPYVDFNLYKSKMLLTKTEYKFFLTIRPICQQHNIIICPKVRMEDFIDTTAYGKEYNRYRNMIKSRHVDFLLTDINLRIVAAIELDDYTHNYARSREADAFKNNVYQAIRIPLFRIGVNENYQDAIIKIISFYEEMKAPNNGSAYV